MVKYVDSLNPYELDHMGLIDLVPLKKSYFIERHEKPKSEAYYMDFKQYYIPPETEPDWNDGLESDDELDF